MKRIRKKKKAARAQENKTSNAFFPGVQTKLAIGKADDAFEKEADHVADEVVNKGSENSTVQKKGTEEEQIQEKPANSITSIQKMEGTEEKEEPVQKMGEKEEGEPVQKMEEKEDEPVQKMEGKEEEPVQKKEEEESLQQKEEEEKPVQAKSNGDSIKNANVETKLKDSKGGGAKMSNGTLSEMEHGFGADFSNINIHTGTEAQNMSEQLGAQAFTSGNDVYFNQGKYNPITKEGKHLLAHELTHTIQQKGKTEKNLQKKVKVTGIDAKTRKKFLAKINDGTSVKFQFGAGGALELADKKAVGTDTFTKKMIGAISAGQMVQLRLVTEDNMVFIDDFDSGKVDITDMMGLSNTIFKSLLVHFVVERFAVKDYEKSKETATDADFLKAHKVGAQAQEAFLKEVYPKKTIKYKSEGYDKSSKVVDKSNNGTIDYVFNFTDVKYVFTQPIKNGKTLENITKSEIKVIK